MEIRPTPDPSGASGRDDSSEVAEDEASESGPTQQPTHEQLSRFSSPPRTNRSGASDGAAVVVSDNNGARMSVTATGGGTVFAVQNGNVFIHRSSGLPPPPQSASGPAFRTRLVTRSIDSMHDVSALQSAVKLTSAAPEAEKPVLLARAAKRVATLLNAPNSWPDADKIDAFCQLVEGAAEALESSDQPDFERYADTTAAFAELIPLLPINNDAPEPLAYLAMLMVQPPLPPQHLEAPTHALFRVAKGMPQPAAYDLFMAHVGRVQELDTGERTAVLKAMASHLDALPHSNDLCAILLTMVVLGFHENKSLGRSILEQVIGRFGSYLEASKEGLSDMGEETKNFYLLLHILEPDEQGDTHVPALAGMAGLCGKLAASEQGRAFDKILEYAARCTDGGNVLKGLIDALPTVQTGGHEDRYRRLCDAIAARGKPQSDELFARLFAQN